MADGSRRIRLGAAGERAARGYLEGRGYAILETNFRCPYGEVDIIAQEGDCLVFLEVRTKSGGGFGSAVVFASVFEFSLLLLSSGLD